MEVDLCVWVLSMPWHLLSLRLSVVVRCTGGLGYGHGHRTSLLRSKVMGGEYGRCGFDRSPDRTDKGGLERASQLRQKSRWILAIYGILLPLGWVLSLV
jgi:hypothetical protein